MKKFALFVVLALLVVSIGIPSSAQGSTCFDYWFIPADQIVVSAWAPGDSRIALANRETYELMVFDSKTFESTFIDGLGQMPIRLAYDGDQIAVAFPSGEVYLYTSWAPEVVSRHLIGTFDGCPEVGFDLDGHLITGVGKG